MVRFLTELKPVTLTGQVLQYIGSRLESADAREASISHVALSYWSALETTRQYVGRQARRWTPRLPTRGREDVQNKPGRYRELLVRGGGLLARPLRMLSAGLRPAASWLGAGLSGVLASRVFAARKSAAVEPPSRKAGAMRTLGQSFTRVPGLVAIRVPVSGRQTRRPR